VAKGVNQKWKSKEVVHNLQPKDHQNILLV
jgi:hypothetical protein